MSWRELVLRVMRVPPMPAPPPGSPPRVFRAAPNFLYLLLIHWGIKQFFTVFGLIAAILFLHNVRWPGMPSWVPFVFTIGEILGAIALALEVLFGWLLVRLNYELRWYMLSDRSLRIREGITTVREKTIALANIQNIAVRQGPLQRLFGIADVEVKTAGGGGSSSDTDHRKGTTTEPMHVAYFRGVTNAEEIRDLLRDAVRMHRDSGLGDPDEPRSKTDDVESAAADLLSAARSLRTALEARPPSPSR